MNSASEFYVNKLGFEVRDAPHPPDVLPLISDGVPLVLREVPDHSKRPSVVLGIETADIAARMRELKNKGIQFSSDEPARLPVGLLASFSDPAGNALELIQWD